MANSASTSEPEVPSSDSVRGTTSSHVNPPPALKRYRVTETSHREDEIIFFALIGISMASVLTILTLSKLSIALWVALTAFAVAIPFLAMNIYILTLEKSVKYTLVPKYIDFSETAGVGGALTGVASIFWHFGRTLGVLFILVALVSVYWLWIFDDALKAANPD